MILLYLSYCKDCEQPIQFVKQNNLSINLVDATTVLNLTSELSIKEVPAIILEDRSTIVGKPLVMEFLLSLKK